MIVNNLFCIVAAIMFGVSLVANNYEMIMIARIIYGYYVGKILRFPSCYMHLQWKKERRINNIIIISSGMRWRRDVIEQREVAMKREKEIIQTEEERRVWCNMGVS